MTGSWSEEWQWHGVLEKEPRHARRDAVRMRAASDANRRCAVLAERACVAAREKKSAACLAFSASFPWYGALLSTMWEVFNLLKVTHPSHS